MRVKYTVEATLYTDIEEGMEDAVLEALEWIDVDLVVADLRVSWTTGFED